MDCIFQLILLNFVCTKDKAIHLICLCGSFLGTAVT
jgi:hypothetical protein